MPRPVVHRWQVWHHARRLRCPLRDGSWFTCAAVGRPDSCAAAHAGNNVLRATLALGEILHPAALEYLPFVILLFALFVISGGIRVRSNLVGTPGINTGLLAFGTGLASLTGTTGAAMLLVRPLIQANLKRRRNAH